MTDGFISKGYSPTESDYEKIRQFTRKEFAKDELYVFEAVLCSNDIDRDYEKFSVSALNELARLFNGKTGIRDHSMKSTDQAARIFETRVEKEDGRKTADGEDYYVLKAKAYMVRTDENQSLIKEIDAGIKKEVSVSCRVNERICSVCGADKAKEYCNHIAGRKYDEKMCFITLNNATDAYEFSFVAVPAQRDAGVEKAFGNTHRTDAESIEKQLKEGETLLSAQEAQTLFDYIGSLKENARLGKDYKKSLEKEILSLCRKALPEMDIEIFSGVTAVMTAKELLAFKAAFEKKTASQSIPAPQLAKAPSTKHKADFSQFRI